MSKTPLPAALPDLGGFYAGGIDTTTLANEGVEMKAILADGEPFRRSDGVQVVITWYGSDGKIGARLRRERQRAAVVNAEIKDPIEREEAEEDAALAYLAGFVKAWNVQLSNGQTADTDIETVTRFLRVFPVARIQGEDFVHRRANFMRPPPKP